MPEGIVFVGSKNMNRINLQQEIKFIHSEKMNIADKDSLSFEVLNIAQVLISNYVNAETKKLKTFYKMVYCKTKNFYVDYFKKNLKCKRTYCLEK